MWRDFQNLVQTVKNYQVMGPDQALRRQVNRNLRSRPYLSIDDWCQWCWMPPAAATPASPLLTRFLYVKLGDYSGLSMGHTRPEDRLLEDLYFPIVCWFDWGLTLCDDIYQTFDVDLTDSFDERDYVTLADLVGYLENQLKAAGTFEA